MGKSSCINNGYAGWDLCCSLIIRRDSKFLLLPSIEQDTGIAPIYRKGHNYAFYITEVMIQYNHLERDSLWPFSYSEGESNAEAGKE